MSYLSDPFTWTLVVALVLFRYRLSDKVWELRKKFVFSMLVHGEWVDSRVLYTTMKGVVPFPVNVVFPIGRLGRFKEWVSEFGPEFGISRLDIERFLPTQAHLITYYQWPLENQPISHYASVDEVAFKLGDLE